MAVEEDLEATEVEASGAVGVSVAETVGASEAAIEDSEVATKWEEGMLKIEFNRRYLLKAALFLDVVLLCGH